MSLKTWLQKDRKRNYMRFYREVNKKFSSMKEYKQALQNYMNLTIDGKDEFDLQKIG